MMRKFPAVYAICTLLFFLLLAAALLFRLNELRDRTIAQREAQFAELRAVFAARTVDGTLDPAAIQRTLSRVTVADGTLRAIAVYSFEGGLEYLWVHNRAYLADGDPRDPPASATPGFAYDRLNEIVLTDTIRTQTGRILVTEAVYRLLDSSAWFALLRDALVAVLLFALVTVLVTVGLLLSGRETADHDLRPSAARGRRNTSGRAAGRPASEGEDAGLFSPASGVSYETHLARRLDLELERAAVDDQDLTFVLARFPGLARGSSGYHDCARKIVEQFLFEDLIFEQGIDGFAIVLPNSDINRAIKQFELFYQQLRRMSLPGKPVFGMTARSGRLVEADRLIREAQQALTKAQSETRPIVAFRADPQKYRDYVVSDRA